MKTHISLALLALVGLTTIGSAAPAPVYREPKVPEIYTAMQGVWEINQNINNAMLMVGGARIARIARIQQQIRIQGNNWAHIINNNGVEAESTKYQIVLDPKASPATLDLNHDPNVAGEIKGGMVVMKGIVKVEGDTLTFCYVYGHQPNAERPKRFVAGNPVMNGVQTMTMTLKRVK